MKEFTEQQIIDFKNYYDSNLSRLFSYERSENLKEIKLTFKMAGHIFQVVIENLFNSYLITTKQENHNDEYSCSNEYFYTTTANNFEDILVNVKSFLNQYMENQVELSKQFKMISKLENFDE